MVRAGSVQGFRYIFNREAPPFLVSVVSFDPLAYRRSLARTVQNKVRTMGNSRDNIHSIHDCARKTNLCAAQCTVLTTDLLTCVCCGWIG